MLLASPQLGFSITSPFKKVANVVKKTVTVPTKYAVKATKVAAKAVYKAHAIPTKLALKAAKPVAKVIYKAHAIPTQWLAIKPTMWLAEKATAPVKKRVQTVVSRRAAKLAWDRRKSKTPTPAERSEARDWTRKRLLMMTPIIPAAPILIAFAGPPGWSGHQLGDYNDYQLGVAPAVVAAAVPVLIAAAGVLINQLNKPGDAPADPTAGGGGAAAPGAPGAPDAAESPPVPGEVDMTPVQDAVDEAGAAAQEAVAQATTPPGSMRVPGVGAVKKNHLIIGGAVVGGLLLVMMMKGGGSKSEK